ncbi:MAG: DegV family protein [Anaerolineae bacterium]|nr:DegV family protein [Anaerolineae bacterium]
MPKVAIVTDSTAYLPSDIIEQYQISVVPQVLIWDGETLRDGIDIKADEFYVRLAKAEVMPTTSQAAVVDFKKIFERLSQAGHDILAVLVSEGLSGTVDSARQAKAMLPEANIEFVNSGTVAMELGFHVLAAARAAESGASLKACKDVAEDARNRTGMVFAVETLEFLHRGGRIGTAARYLGTALQLKPILTIADGLITPLERVRTKRKSHQRLVELIAELAVDYKKIKLAVIHANAAEDAQALLTAAEKTLKNVSETIFTGVSPIVGTHVGPGTVALAFMGEEKSPFLE